jgi:cell division protein FtsI (penicillin-binding protein 3)
MQELLSETVSPNGTAPLAQVPGYKIIGKTGTAQIPYPNKPGYQPGAFMATFVGFTQGTSTPLSAIVVLEHPNPIYGGSVAAPVFSEIMGYALRRMDVAPTSGYLPSGYARGSLSNSASKTGTASAAALVLPTFGGQSHIVQYADATTVSTDKFTKTKGSLSP